MKRLLLLLLLPIFAFSQNSYIVVEAHYDSWGPQESQFYITNNNGDTISRTKALKIVKRIKKHHKSGKLDEYAVNYKHELSKLPDSDCDICNGTGKRKSIPERGAGNIHCNGCDGKGKQQNWGKSYPFDVDNVLEFATFAENSGGFQIC